MKKTFVEAFILLMAALVLLLFSQQPSAAQSVKVVLAATPAVRSPSRILFVGDSTLWYLDNHFKSMAAVANPPLNIKTGNRVAGGAPLEALYESASKEIKKGNWDMVVLEEDLADASASHEKFSEVVRSFHQDMKQLGGQTVLLIPWEWKGGAMPIAEIAQIYTELGQELGIKVAPVHLAWQRSIKERPDLGLYTDDEIHANRLGTYLTLAVLYGTIFEQSPVGLSYRYEDISKTSQEYFWRAADDRGSLTDDEAAFLQRIAWETVQEYAVEVAPTPTATPQPTGELNYEKINSQALANNLVGDPAERGYFVYLPPGYADGNKRYPVVYILHGATGTEHDFIFMKDDYEDMLEKGTAQEMILVFPNGNNKFKGSNYISSPTIGDYETYLARELVAQIDANYRTIPHRNSRGITGCSMGGDGSMHLALTFPDVYNVVAPMSATYDFANDPTIPKAAAYFTHIPQDFNDLNRYWYAGNGNTAFYVSLAAGASPNPDKPPFYLDMPFEVVDGQGRIVPEVWEKIAAVDVVHDLEEYLQQSTRLDHILLYHGALDDCAPVELARSFDQLLTERSVDHEYVEVKSGHCAYDMKPVLQYLSDHLVAEQSSMSESPTVTLDSALVSKIEAAISQTMKIYQLPGLSIGIIKDGQVAYTKGFGLAEVGTDRAVTPEIVFQLASNSKTVVVTAIMQLKEQGKIDLDAPVTTYLPYFRLADERYKEITIRQLLSHRSGLPYNTKPGYYWYDSDYQSPEFDEGSLERHVRNLTQLKLLNAPGSERGYYSDLGFEILGDVIAKVSDQSFEDYTQEHIFAPLEMKHTSFMVQHIPPELLAAPHVQQGAQTGVNSFFPYSRQHAPSSHLLSNVADMNRFALAQLNRGQLGEVRILPAAAYEEMWGTTYEYNLPSPPETGYGLGWGIGELAGHRMIDHGGLDIGFHSEFLMAPDDGLSIIIMANRDYDSWDLQIQVMQWLLETKG